MFEITKYKKSNVKLSIRLPEEMNNTLRKIAKKEDMSFNNVIVSCIQNSLDQIDLKKYDNAKTELKVKINLWCVSGGRIRKTPRTNAPYYPFQNQL